MSDNAKFEELAEALKRAIEQAEHKPGEWAETAQSMGGICCPGVPFQIGKPWAKEEPWASFSYKRDSWLAVAAVNALPQMMALIAENERLERLALDSVNAEYAAQMNLESICAQRDQLKAENELLESSRAKLVGQLSRLHAKHKDWSAGTTMGKGEQS